MDVTPSPRILRMLGEIEFAEWQCVAELVDNAFDDFTEVARSGRSWPGGYKVVVSLPSSGPLDGAEIVVRDTGRGMTRETLEQAVKAGWSSNDRFDKLGLFGMGFNVATARLGRRTRVLTSREGDPEWIGVEINLDTLGSDFSAPDISEPKSDPSEHGTRIIVDGLFRDRAEWFQRNAESLRTTLGRVYGWLLDNQPYELWVQGVRVKPRRACRWGDDRFVIYGSGAGAEKIPAYIEIDESFEPADSCDLCGNWQSRDKGVCDECGSDRLQVRERRLHGWLGVQRHLDKRDFGIDFLRNGRKILMSDKSLFEWRNPNDPTGATDIEYPVELANQGGRLIGEIHLDYVPVHYDKTAFEYSDRSWRAAVEYLRGEAPMQPQKAKTLGFTENASPLARLHRGFRRNDAGLRSLIPGDGSRPVHEDTRAWARKFWAGDPEYQTDEKWYAQVELHEERQRTAKVAKATGSSPADADEDAVLRALGIDLKPGPTSPMHSIDPAHSSPEPDSPRPETLQERIERYRIASTAVPDLSRDYGLPLLGALKVEARELDSPVANADGEPTPVWLVQGSGGTATAFISTRHDAFTKLGLEPSELVLVEVASALRVKADSHQSLSHLTALLRAACLPDTAIDHAVVRAQANELLVDIRQRMVLAVNDDPQRALSYLDPDEQTQTETALIADSGNSLEASLAGSGNFISYAPPLYLVKLLESWPEAFLDGRVFSGSYTSLASAASRRLSLARVSGYLNDIATLIAFQSAPNIVQLKRTRLSVELLSRELA